MITSFRLPDPSIVPRLQAWAFRPRLRRRAFGWRGSRKAVEVIASALAEITRAARSDPALAGEGAVVFLEKISPAVGEVDSSSGSLGNATAAAVAALVPIIAAAPVAQRLREKWLDRLFEAYQEDDPPYIESLGPLWGDLCAGPELASAWAERLLPGVRMMMADRRRGVYAYSKSMTPCLSALFVAGRFDELLDVLASDPRPFTYDQQWAARVLAARGDVDGAVRTLEALRRQDGGGGMLAALAEKLLLDAGRIEEAYRRYALESTQANTYVAKFRSIAKRYPGIELILLPFRLALAATIVIVLLIIAAGFGILVTSAHKGYTEYRERACNEPASQHRCATTVAPHERE